ncbi:MAG: hypothetical protein QOJ89_4119 [bacterium]
MLDERRYLAPFGIPVNVAWLLAPAMRELGFDRAADRVAGSLAAAALRDGFREYYDPLTGRGLGARGFGWSTLLHELVTDSPDAGIAGRAMTE